MPVNVMFKNKSLKAHFLITGTALSLGKCEDDLFPITGLTSQQLQVLWAITQLPDPVTQIDIANYLDRDATTITHIIDRMSKDNLVERVRDLKDRRFTRLIVSSKGHEIMNKAGEITHQQMMEIMATLSLKETDTLIKLLEKIRDKTFIFRNVHDKVKVINPRFEEGSGSGYTSSSRAL